MAGLVPNLGGGALAPVSGLSNGLPLDTVTGVAQGAGGGNALAPVSGLTNGLPVGGDALGSVTNLAGGLTGADGSPLDAVGGLANGLLGGSQGLNVLGLAAIGSDEDALLDLGPAEKKKVKAAKEAAAKRNAAKRELAMKQLREQVQKQGGKPTPEQLELAEQLNKSQEEDDATMARMEKILGPTDPELLRQAEAEQAQPQGQRSGGAVSSGPSQGLFYAYLVNGQTYTPTHVLTFPNAAAAQQWYASASKTGTVEKASEQMYVYTGTPPGLSGRMGCMPISGTQPIIPLQHGDGYPICCKGKGGAGGSSDGGYSGSSASGAGYGSGSGSNASYQPAARPAPPPPPPRKKLTFQDAAESHAANAIAKGDKRPKDEIVREAMEDLQANCASVNGNCSSAQPGYANGTGTDAPAQQQPAAGPVPALNGLAPVPAVPGVPALGGQGAPAGLGGTLGGLGNTLPVGGDLLGGLLPGSQGLNVAGILAIGSDEDAALDLSPGEKRKVKQEKQRKIAEQRQLQDRQLQALQAEIRKNNGVQTAQQRAMLKELEERRRQLDAVQKKVDSDGQEPAVPEQAAGPADAVAAPLKKTPLGGLI